MAAAHALPSTGAPLPVQLCFLSPAKGSSLPGGSSSKSHLSVRFLSLFLTAAITGSGAWEADSQAESRRQRALLTESPWDWCLVAGLGGGPGRAAMHGHLSRRAAATALWAARLAEQVGLLCPHSPVTRCELTWVKAPRREGPLSSVEAVLQGGCWLRSTSVPAPLGSPEGRSARRTTSASQDYGASPACFTF